MKEFGFVNVLDLDPTLIVDLPYSVRGNIMGQPVYPVNKALLRREVAEALIVIHRKLIAEKDLRIKIWDGYRPFSIQEQFWSEYPNSEYVAEPIRSKTGEMLEGSNHSRGAAVDCTMVDAKGNDVEMPSLFDDFSERAHRNFMGATQKAIYHRQLLENSMHAGGFTGFSSEWWHFDFNGWEKFPLCDDPLV